MDSNHPYPGHGPDELASLLYPALDHLMKWYIFSVVGENIAAVAGSIYLTASPLIIMKHHACFTPRTSYPCVKPNRPRGCCSTTRPIITHARSSQSPALNRTGSSFNFVSIRSYCPSNRIIFLLQKILLFRYFLNFHFTLEALIVFILLCMKEKEVENLKHGECKKSLSSSSLSLYSPRYIYNTGECK